MSDLMLLGILRMPENLIKGSVLSLMQFIQAARGAADRIESDAKIIEQLRADLEAAAADKRELSALLPGPYYMDPPDGGDVSLIEQLRRMAKDAERYRLLHGCHDDFDILHWRNAGWKSTSGSELDEAIDALAQRQGEGS